MIEVPVNNRTREWATTALRIMAVAVAYYASAQVGLLLALVNGQVTPLWPATGIAVVCLLLWGVRIWPGIPVAAFVVNMSVNPMVSTAVLISVGNTLAPVVAYLLLRRVRFSTELRQLRDTLALVFLGAFAGMSVSATVGSLALMSTGALASGDFWSTWWVWWTGDAMGVLIFVPLLFAAGTLRQRLRTSWWRRLEATMLLVGTFLVTLLATTSKAHLLFLVFPFLVWAALRFQLAGAAPCALIVSTVAIIAAAHEWGTFAGLALLPKMITLQAFNGSVALLALLLAAITSERDQARETIERAVAQLADALVHYQPGRDLLQGRLLESVREARRRSSKVGRTSHPD